MEPDRAEPSVLLALADAAQRACKDPSTTMELDRADSPPPTLAPLRHVASTTALASTATLSGGHHTSQGSITLPSISHLRLDPSPDPPVRRPGSHRKTNSMSICSLIDPAEETTRQTLHRKRPSQADLTGLAKSPRLPELPPVRFWTATTAADAGPAHEKPPPPLVEGSLGLPVSRHHPLHDETRRLPSLTGGALASHRRHQSWSVGQHTDPAVYAPGAEPQGPSAHVRRGPPTYVPAASHVATALRRTEQRLRPNVAHAFIAYMIFSDQLRTGTAQPTRRSSHAHSQSQSDATFPGGLGLNASHTRSKTVAACHRPTIPTPPGHPPLAPEATYSSAAAPLAGYHLSSAAHARSVSMSGAGRSFLGPRSNLPPRRHLGPDLSPEPTVLAYSRP
ncbi:hypothetical protein IWQ60_006757 [Tieghemiomyces parasiticus]|uniref:Uncharacterized protein n=1 Tax=Tieghemiomyces parasiticus TaxID=78921 RepID=A0A9W8DWE7_9FUNG|nr:hypothetical protein IWQ60_006757 [Tieghemiomyces parasiticus]